VIALLTTCLLLAPAVAVGVVLAWAESQARLGATTLLEQPRLTNVLLAAREDEEFPQPAGLRARMLGCP
jgi:hypothetical protein